MSERESLLSFLDRAAERWLIRRRRLIAITPFNKPAGRGWWIRNRSASPRSVCECDELGRSLDDECIYDDPCEAR